LRDEGLVLLFSDVAGLGVNESVPDCYETEVVIVLHSKCGFGDAFGVNAGAWLARVAVGWWLGIGGGIFFIGWWRLRVCEAAGTAALAARWGIWDTLASVFLAIM